MDKLLSSKAKRNGSYLSEAAAATEAEFQRLYDDALSKLYELAADNEQLRDELSQKHAPMAKNDELPAFQCEVPALSKTSQKLFKYMYESFI